MEILGPATGSEALSKDDILEKYGSAIDQIIKASIDPQHDSERQIQITQAKLLWQFNKGNHYSVPGDVTDSYGNETVGWVPFDYANDNQQSGAQVKLCPPINLIGSDCFKYMAVMGQSSPAVKGIADDPQDPESMYAGHIADINIRDLWVKQKVNRKWKAIAFHQFVTGPVFIRTYWNTDRRKYGETQEPKIEIGIGPDGVPVPHQVGVQSYANGDAELAIHSIIDVSVPYQATELPCGYLRCETMRSKWALLAKYKGTPEKPGRLEQYRDGDVPDDNMTGADATANEARTAVANPSGTGVVKQRNDWRHMEIWLDPDQYEAAPKEARDVFYAHFADGMYVAKVGNITVDLENEKVTDSWAVCRVGRGEKIMERPISSDVLPIQRAINDLVGMALETILRAIPQTIMDARLIDRNAMNTNEAIPGEIILTAMPVDGDIQKLMAQIPPARLTDQLRPFLEFLISMMHDIDGIRPELSGGGAPTQTFREAKQRKDQALAQLAPQAEEMRFSAETVAENLVRLRAKYGSGTVKASRKSAYGSQTDVADIASLKDTGWHAEADDNFPMTLADQRDALWSMLKEFPPEVQQALSILDPINIGIVCELLQISGFESAVQDQKEKTLEDVRQLLQGSAIEGAPGPDGQPGPKQPSLPPDPYDNHGLVAGIMQRWLVANQKEKNTNPAGFENVEARQAAEQQLAQPPVPPPPPPVKPSVALSLKLEDAPQYIDPILQAAGVGLPPAPPPTPGPAGQAPDLSAPRQIGGPPMQESPLPPFGQHEPPPGPPPAGGPPN